jgi:hypothetical protein
MAWHAFRNAKTASWSRLKVAILLLALSFACSSEAEAVAFGEMKGVVLNWSEGLTTGSFDLDVGGELTHFYIDMKQTTVDGVRASRWAGGMPSPFGTNDNPKRLCALVVFHRVGKFYYTALTITILREASASPNPCPSP